MCFLKNSKIIPQFTLLIVFLFSGMATANESFFQRSNVTVGISGWISTGQTDWNHDASSSASFLGNPSSELTYENLDSTIVELSAECNIKRDYFVRGNVGFGSVDNGTLIDDDFGTTPATGDFLGSRSMSDIDEDGIWFVNVDFGYTLWSATGNQSSRLRAFIGYQHWEEDYSAKGLTYEVCTVGANLLGICLPRGTSEALGQTVISNKVEWDSLRVGVEGKKNLGKGFSVEVSAVFIPYADMHNEDIHHLRTDLRQPGFVMDGTGIGFDLEFAVSYEVLKNLLLTAGYKYWGLESDGDIEVRGTSGINVFPLNDLNSSRKGMTVGLTYQF